VAEKCRSAILTTFETNLRREVQFSDRSPVREAVKGSRDRPVHRHTGSPLSATALADRKERTKKEYYSLSAVLIMTVAHNLELGVLGVRFYLSSPTIY
jgi:hypothetical protein